MKNLAPKILHITQDDKFTNTANLQFQSIFPDSNDFFIITSNIENYKLIYVNKQSNFTILRENEKSYKYILNHISKYDLIILHNLDFFKSKIVLHTNRPVLWLFWGFELYNNNKFLKKNIFGPKTLKIHTNVQKRSLKAQILELTFKIRKKRLYMNRVINKAAKKIENFGSTVFEEYEMLKSQGIIDADFFYFSYYNLELYITNKIISSEKKNKILLGNSGTTTNNHFEAIDILRQFKNDNLQIIAPLNYGDMDYAKKISDTGKKIFGDNFKPLTTFLPLEEYNKILNECKIFIMNSYRQQALGNIYTMLYLGAKVYLDERNLSYKFLKRIGCIVFSINTELKPENKEALDCLSQEQQEINRTVIENEFGGKNLNSQIKNQLIQILSKN